MSLADAWERHPARHLDTYLVSGREDPRINPQSILNRALLADSLCPGRFDDLISHELRFGATLTGLLAALESGAPRQDLLDSLPDDAPDYATAALMAPPEPEADGGAPFPRSVLDTFMLLWTLALDGLDAPPLSVAEAACGSANEYRFLDASGLARFLDYTGYDLAPTNIANARRRFPATPFLVADARQPPFPDRAFDFLFAHDLFEHLPPDGLEAALANVARTTRCQAWLHFFNLGTGDTHQFEPAGPGGYHWNLLSEGELVASLERLGASAVEVVRIPDLLAAKAPGAPPYPNPEAATAIVTFAASGT
jgi:hypothetical protein